MHEEAARHVRHPRLAGEGEEVVLAQGRDRHAGLLELTVHGWLTPEAVARVLDQIAALPAES